MVKSPCCEKISVKRGVWSAEEDAKILAFVSKHGSGNWTSVPKKAGLKRCRKSCRLRWTNYLRPDLKHDTFTPQEEDLIIKLHAAIGSRWSIIAQQLQGRTDNDVKNYWNTKLKKKLSQMGIDPVTHKPFSKLIADYGNIGSGGGCQKQSTRIGGTVNKDLKNAMMPKSEPYQNQTLPQEFRSINNQPNQKQSPNTSPPKMEPDENNFLFNMSHNENVNNPSMDFAQIQAMSTTSSPSSTSSNCSTTAQETLPLPFSWNDFLLEDAFAPPPIVDDNHEHDMVGDFMSNDLLVSHMENVTWQSWNKKEVKSLQGNSNDFRFSSSSSSSTEISFVEAMLDQENEMFLSFPHLMEEPPNY